MPTFNLQQVNGEPRIRDLELGERLGFERPRDIRDLIKRHESKLLTFGVCAAVPQTSGVKGGRPANEYYLNQKQSLFVCMKSDTDNAFEVQAEIIRVFDAYLNGALDMQPVPRSFADALQLAADQQRLIEQQSAENAQLTQQVEVMKPKSDFYDQVVFQEKAYNFTELFGILKHHVGQTFTRKTFLEFLRKHGIACQPNPHIPVGKNQFKPRQNYLQTWFICEPTPAGGVEWLIRPIAVSHIVRLMLDDEVFTQNVEILKQVH